MSLGEGDLLGKEVEVAGHGAGVEALHWIQWHYPARDSRSSLAKLQLAFRGRDPPEKHKKDDRIPFQDTGTTSDVNHQVKTIQSL